MSTLISKMIMCLLAGIRSLMGDNSTCTYCRMFAMYGFHFPSNVIRRTAGKKILSMSSLSQAFERFDEIGRMLGQMAPTSRPSSDMAEFRNHFAKAKHIAVLTGAGVSAESGVPTFRGAGGFWRTFQAQDLATPGAFNENPSLVWEFYHYRREVMLTKEPNKAHTAIAECEKRLAAQNRRVVVITQNIDELHIKAGSQNVLEIHGNLFKTRCLKCGDVSVNKDSPICPALAGKGAPDPSAEDARIPVKDLPRCKKAGCGGLLRPHVVWFGESLDPEIMKQTDEELNKCDLLLVIGTSSVVYPAAAFAPTVARRDVPVAEFNIEETPTTGYIQYHFSGPAGQHVPTALAKHESEPEN